jgi:N-acetylmuramoyl-L-alanine amidase
MGRLLGVAVGLLMAAAALAERVPLGPRLAALGLKETRLTEGSSVFSNRFHTIVVRENSRRIELDGVGVYLNGPVLHAGVTWSIDRVDWAESVGFLWINVPPRSRRKTDLVLLDPGHGGEDPGAISRRHVEESRVTMDVARRVGKLLSGRGVAVRFTRDGNTALGLEERIAINRKLKPDAFVAIHVNATVNAAVNGIETFIMAAPGYSATAGGREDEREYDGNRNGVLNTRLAFAIQDNLLAYTGADDRGVKRARFAVIKNSPVPGVLVEMGFLTNSGEESLLISRVYRDRIAAGIARGILSYLTTQRKPPTAKKKEG